MNDHNTVTPGPGRPPSEATAAAGHIHLRVTMERKNRYVRAAQKTGRGLSQWITDTCDTVAPPTKTK